MYMYTTFRHVDAGLQVMMPLLIHFLGGTDIISCFAGQNPTMPVYRGQIQYRNLGMAMECWNEKGNVICLYCGILWLINACILL